jgi:hypothetical protein
VRVRTGGERDGAVTGRVSVGCNVIVDTLLHSHASTRAIHDLIGKRGYIVRLVPRGSSTYALTEMFDMVRGYPEQRKWPFHVNDLYVVTGPHPALLAHGPVVHAVGFEAYPAELRVMRGTRHAVPASRAQQPLTESVCGLIVRPAHSPTWPTSFDPIARISCPGCAEGLVTHHPDLAARRAPAVCTVRFP